MPPPNPLTEQDLERINTGLAQAREAQELIDMASRAGIDVEEFRVRARDSQEKLLRMKQVFFPGQ